MNIESWYEKNHHSFEKKFFDTWCLRDIYQTYLDTVHEHCPSMISGGRLLEEASGSFSIVNAGIMNSGKSSLFNSLLGRDVFAVQDIRCTQKNKTVGWEDGIALTDTPGLEANESDTGEAYESFRKADLIVFVHVADKGGLTMSEVQAVRELKNILGGSLQKRLVIVLSKIDNSAISSDENSIGLITQEVTDNLSREAGLSGIRIFPVSNSRYQKGISENKAGLVRRSGVPELAAYIRDFRKKYRKDPYLDALQKGKNALVQFRSVLGRLPISEQLSTIEAFRNKADAAIQKISRYEKKQFDALDELSSLLSSAEDALDSSLFSSGSLNDILRQFSNHDFYDYDGEISDQTAVLSELASELPERTYTWSTVPAMKKGIKDSLKTRKGMLNALQSAREMMDRAVQAIDMAVSSSGVDRRGLLTATFDGTVSYSITNYVKTLEELANVR